MELHALIKLTTIGCLSGFMTATAIASPPPVLTDDPNEQTHEFSLGEQFVLPVPHEAMMEHDAAVEGMVVSDGPSANVTKNLALSGHGVRLQADATTDVWALGNYAYTGTFNNPCGGEENAGIFIWDVRNRNNVSQAGFIPSPEGSRTNDVKVASLNSGDILVHSNESCGGGPGGFEVYNVNDPANPEHLAHVQVDEIANITPLFWDPGTLEDNGVHNLWLFSQGSNDYVAAQSEGVFDGFQVFDITDPANPSLVSGWGAEEIFDPGVGDLVLADDPTGGRTLASINWMFGGFGASQNRFLHDFTITADGLTAYLAHWDAGLIRLDISDVASPQLTSVAIDPTSEDGEVNSHSVWPNADGSIVVEGEEDFSPFESQFSIDSGPNAGIFASAEGAITTPIANQPDGAMSGPTTYVGLACTSDSVPVGTGIALIQRGVCAFTTKGNNVIGAGYSGMVVFNDAARGDALVTMGGVDITIPGVFVGHSTGLSIMDVASAGDLVVGDSGADVTAAVVPNGWSGIRIWDYSDPANPVLASTFNTVCSANPVDDSCDPRGTYSSHNVQVEDNKAYISWYTDGLLVVDVSDPYNPVETARYHRSGADFEAENGGIQDIWGIYKVEDEPWIYASERNGGLVVLKEYGSGSAKKAKQ